MGQDVLRSIRGVVSTDKETDVYWDIKFIHSEKATKFCEISTNYLTGSTYIGQIIGGDFAKFCGLLRIYEL